MQSKRSAQTQDHGWNESGLHPEGKSQSCRCCSSWSWKHLPINLPPFVEDNSDPHPQTWVIERKSCPFKSLPMQPCSFWTRTFYAQLAWAEGWGWLLLPLSMNPCTKVTFCLSELCTYLRTQSAFFSPLSVAILPWMTTEGVTTCNRLLQTHFAAL